MTTLHAPSSSIVCHGSDTIGLYFQSRYDCTHSNESQFVSCALAAHFRVALRSTNHGCLRARLLSTIVESEAVYHFLTVQFPLTPKQLHQECLQVFVTVSRVLEESLNQPCISVA